jgi:hypothetical protein
MPGYFLVNRATRDIRHITDAVSSNRGCFDIQPIPNFDMRALPFVICKGRKGLTVLNLKSFVSHELFPSDDMQANSLWEKMVLVSPPKKLTSSGVGSYILTYAVWRDSRSCIEQIEIPDLFFRALQFD